MSLRSDLKLNYIGSKRRSSSSLTVMEEGRGRLKTPSSSLTPMAGEIGANSYGHYDLSEIKVVGKRIIFPRYYLDDYYADFFDELEIDATVEGRLASVDKEDVDWETLHLVRTEQSSALIWYPALAQWTMPSQLIPYEEDLSIVKFPAFVKLDTVSAKDTGHNGIFASASEVFTTFTASQRIQAALTARYTTQPHYFVREILPAGGRELRCFIYHGKLTAISVGGEGSYEAKEVRELGTAFVASLADALPYNDIILDLNWREGQLTLVEVATFGADSHTGSGNFCWREDYAQLHGLLEDASIAVR